MFIRNTQDFIGGFIVFVIVLIVVMSFQNMFNNLTYVKSNFDNRRYLVQNNKDKQEAADILAKINLKLTELINYMVQQHPNDDRVKRCKKNYIPDNISEAIFNSKHTSYSINKGEKVVLCIRAKPSGKIEDLNTLLFVAIHELGHLGSVSIGHTDEFWKTFKFFLENAVQCNVYNPVDYESNPIDYCGIKITDSPIYEHFVNMKKK